MSEEEKKAIESLKWYFEDSKSLDIAKQTDIVLNLIEKMKEIIESKNRTIESLSLESDKWFVSSVNKQKAYVELERKTDEIIDELITALAEERGIDEDEIREDFLNDR